MIVKLVRKKLKQNAPKGFRRLAPAHDKSLFAPHGAVLTYGSKALYSLGPAGSEQALLVDKQGKLYKAKRGTGNSVRSIERVSVLAAMASMPDGAFVDAIDRIGRLRDPRNKTTSVIKSLERVLRTDYLGATLRRLDADVRASAVHSVLELAGVGVLAQKNGNSLMIDSRGQLYIAPVRAGTGPHPAARVILPGTAKALFGKDAIVEGLRQLQWRTRFRPHQLGDTTVRIRNGSLLERLNVPLRARPRSKAY